MSIFPSVVEKCGRNCEHFFRYLMVITNPGEYIAPGMDICNTENHVIPLRLIKGEMDTLLVLFIPHCFGVYSSNNTILSLIKEISDIIDIFRQRSIRVVGISRFHTFMLQFSVLISTK